MVKPPPGFEPGTSRLVRGVLYPLSYGGNRPRRGQPSLLSAPYGRHILGSNIWNLCPTEEPMDIRLRQA